LIGSNTQHKTTDGRNQAPSAWTHRPASAGTTRPNTERNNMTAPAVHKVRLAPKTPLDGTTVTSADLELPGLLRTLAWAVTTNGIANAKVGTYPEPALVADTVAELDMPDARWKVETQPML